MKSRIELQQELRSLTWQIGKLYADTQAAKERVLLMREEHRKLLIKNKLFILPPTAQLQRDYPMICELDFQLRILERRIVGMEGRMWKLTAQRKRVKQALGW